MKEKHTDILVYVRNNVYFCKTRFRKQYNKGKNGINNENDMYGYFHKLANSSKNNIFTTKNGYQYFGTPNARIGIHQSSRGGGTTIDLDIKGVTKYKIRSKYNQH